MLREHGALLTFRGPAAAAEEEVEAALGLLTALFPADLLREKGHRLMLSSAVVAAPPLFLSLFFSLISLSLVPPEGAGEDAFLLVFWKMSLQRFDD